MGLTLSVGLLVVAFLCAGVVNAIGPAKVRRDFARWGYPVWWRFLTGGLEIACATLVAYPATRIFGFGLAVAILTAAVVTVLRHRDFSHFLPLGVFAGLTAIAWALS